MNDDLKATLERILATAQDRAAYEELRGDSPAYKPDCVECDATGWKMLTSGKVTTAGGHEMVATSMVPVATRCPRGCRPPMTGKRAAKAQPSSRELTP